MTSQHLKVPLTVQHAYIMRVNTHTEESGAENSLFQFWLTITKPFSPFYLEETKNYRSLVVSRAVSQLIMRVNKPTFAYKLVQLYSKNLKVEPWLIIMKTKKQLIA